MLEYGTRNKTVCFTGHRVIRQQDAGYLREHIQSHMKSTMEKGAIHFLSGGALGFDTIAAQAVIDLRERDHPEISLTLVLPCQNQANNWGRRNIEIYEELKRQSDSVIYTSTFYHPSCMFLRNRYLVDHASYCICYHYKQSGGTTYTVNYALSQGLPVLYC